MEFNIPGAKEYMTNERFWINKLSSANQIIMTPDEIKAYNCQVTDKVPSMCVVKHYPEYLSYDELYRYITSYNLPQSDRYDDEGTLISQETYEKIIENTNLNNINKTNHIFFGLTINSTKVRSFPTDMGCYKENTSTEFDRFQETEAPGAVAVAILHASSDGKWYFIQMYNYMGWISAIDVAIASEKSKVFDYIDGDSDYADAGTNFLMITGDKAVTQFHHYDDRLSRRTFYMGTKLPLVNTIDEEIGNQSSALNYAVKLPLRDKHGFLEFGTALISRREPVHVGNVPYTLENILNEAFVLLGDRYDWGNKHNGRDCSSYVMNIYRTCGLELPRNADDQENCPGNQIAFDKEATIYERTDIIKSVQPGALVFMEGHVMLYVGMNDNEPFIIHDFHCYSTGTLDSLSIHNANEVAVTSTYLNTSAGTKFIMEFTSILQLKL